jgi:hypothetical protein
VVCAAVPTAVNLDFLDRIDTDKDKIDRYYPRRKLCCSNIESAKSAGNCQKSSPPLQPAARHDRQMVTSERGLLLSARREGEEGNLEGGAQGKKNRRGRSGKRNQLCKIWNAP